MSYVLYMTSPNSVDPVLFERLLQSAVSASAIDDLCRERGWKVRRGIYSLVVVIWLMIYQRLNSKRTLSSAVQFLARHANHWQEQPHVGKRVRECRISTRTGGYCQARRKMPTLVLGPLGFVLVLELLPGLFAIERPVDSRAFSIDSPVPSMGFGSKDPDISEPALPQALLSEQADFEFRLVQPTPMDRRIVNGEPIP